MRFIWSTALKDLYRRRRDPVSLVGWVAIPIVITLLLQLIFGGRGAAPRGLLLVADEDATFASSLLLGAFNQGRLGEMFAVEKVKQEDGRTRIRKGDGSALLIIPKGFGRALLRNEPAQLKLLTNPAQQILPGIIEETLSILLDGAFYLQALAGDQLRTFAGGPPQGARTFPDATITSFSVWVNRLVDRTEAYLSPLLIELKTTRREEGPSFNFAEAFFPAMLFMALLFMAQGLSADIWKEHAQGALRRVASSPMRIEAFFMGKLVGAAALVAVVGLVGLLAGRYLGGLKISNAVPALVWVTFAGSVLFLLMTFLQLLASNVRTANILTSVVLFPMAMLGGSFFPFEVMPERLAAIGRLTPNGWAVVQFKAILAGAVEPQRLAVAFVALMAAGAVAFLLAIRRLRRLL